MGRRRRELRDGAGRKAAYGLFEDIGPFRVLEVRSRAPNAGQSRRVQGTAPHGLKTSSNGRVLYIYVAGNTIDLYDAATYQYLRTITNRR
jgi:hypothetical protein